MNTGAMPSTDFRFEEFEALLASFYLSLQPLKISLTPDDVQDYDLMVAVLNGFANRYDLQSPEVATENPRSNEEWAQPKCFSSCHTIVDMLGSFGRDFGVGNEPNSEDRVDIINLSQTIIGVMVRHKILEARIEIMHEKAVFTKITKWNDEKKFQSLEAVL